MIDTKKCLICQRKNSTLHWHIDPDSGAIWVWCNGRCQRGYSIYNYCYQAGISLSEFLNGDFDFQEATPNEVQKMEWPDKFIPLSDPRAKKALQYLKSRGLTGQGDFYYDMEYEGIVFPLYFGSVFVGAQIRLLKPWVNKDGDTTKISTIPGTRSGLLFWNYNQENIMPNVKSIVVCEGAFNAASIQQSLNAVYGSAVQNPFKAIAASGSGASLHQRETLKELKDNGYKIICATDRDEAGLKALKKYTEFDCLTHFCLTDTASDWNDELQRLGQKEFTKYFLQRIKPVYIENK